MGAELIYIIIGFIITLGIGLFVGVYIQKLKTKSTESVWESKEIEFRKTESSLKEEIKEIQSRKSEIEIALAKEESKSDNLEEKLLEQKQELEKLQEKFTKEFENMANKILDEKSEKFTKSNKENIDNILDPLNKKIKEFEEKVVKSQQENFGLHAALKQQLLDLRSQNLKITQEAENLTKALKGDSKMQGNWGEVILTRILEKSGLTKDREYTLQDSFKDEEGKRYQTDVLIHLPDGKKMIVDSKVSIVHFERYVSDEDEKQREIYLKQHIDSIKRHIEELSKKNYQLLIDESPDTVFMFIPTEPAFAIASAFEPNLYEDAFVKDVIIVTPSTLLAALKLVDNLWKNDKQKRFAIEIATEAGKLYDSFTNLTDELLKIGNQIGTVQNTYQSTMKKLTGRGNLIKRVEKLKSLGAKASKSIDDKLLKRALDDDFEELN
ncbi:MAG TPA: DNA recombination protein RmuC [Muricauda sp.]|uniref:DNA recombination protein RmuC n=1 Tax=Flagellimonas aurea TaxID=2915619 RepID=A0ABS3G428_9FLAO|nr:DNA recombination protein RmuC [Allomuricauda aurea]MAO16930.1 DNA recombination protein RmuC [Allomuricauda sp.]MBO0354179.1 DNA recombination protein RmuC [Allomuricauda aurea]HBU79693.1 DNA recombination protein RmuC [Allomuricauda sp.]|tara:strand:- start:334 stop:1647 length:1314 start_codon:yes stop_codon:yes gene_type:complete